MMFQQGNEQQHHAAPSTTSSPSPSPLYPLSQLDDNNQFIPTGSSLRDYAKHILTLWKNNENEEDDTTTTTTETTTTTTETTMTQSQDQQQPKQQIQSYDWSGIPPGVMSFGNGGSTVTVGSTGDDFEPLYAIADITKMILFVCVGLVKVLFLDFVLFPIVDILIRFVEYCANVTFRICQAILSILRNLPKTILEYILGEELVEQMEDFMESITLDGYHHHGHSGSFSSVLMLLSELFVSFPSWLIGWDDSTTITTTAAIINNNEDTKGGGGGEEEKDAGYYIDRADFIDHVRFERILLD